MQVSLGASSIATSALVLGCARLGSALTPLGRDACVSLVEQAYALGVRHFDTASIYGQGDSERFIGQALRRQRALVCLSSKAGQRLTPAQSLLTGLKTPIRWMAARHGRVHRSLSQARAGTLPLCFKPDFIEQSLYASLQRLDTDHLDIFYLHSPDAAALADEALFTRLDRLRQQGLFRALGVSCDDEALAWQAATHDAVQVVQLPLSPGLHSGGLLHELARRGKRAVLRGLIAGGNGGAPGFDTLAQRFADTVRLPAFGGVIVGTTQLQHLRHNVAAFRRATLMGQEA